MKKLLSLFIFFLQVLAFGSSREILVLNVMRDVDAGLSHYIDLGFERAERDSIHTVVLHMDTYGGGVKEADEIVDRITGFDGTVVVFVDSKATSAGSYISVSCDSIYMTSDATIGASTVIDQNGTVQSEKIQSHMRSRFRALAESKGGDSVLVDGEKVFRWKRDPKIAEGFVGKALGTDTAEVYSFTTGEAREKGFCDGTFNDIDEVISFLGFSPEEKVEFQLDPENALVAFFLNPVVKSILIMMILGGVYMELKSPGIGLPIGVAVLGVVGYFVPDYLHGLLEVWELLLFIIGVVLIAVEVFVIPGFGAAGISGIVLVLTGLLFSMIGNVGFDFRPVPLGALQNAFAVMCSSVFLGSLFIIFAGLALVKSKRFKSLTIQESITENATGIDKNQQNKYVGKTGTAITDLRPSGRIKIEDEIYDAVTQGGFVSKGANVKVLSRRGVSFVVKEIKSPQV